MTKLQEMVAAGQGVVLRHLLDARRAQVIMTWGTVDDIKRLREEIGERCEHQSYSDMVHSLQELCDLLENALTIIELGTEN